MAALNLSNAQWRKSSRSLQENCVELRPLTARVAARDSRNPVQTPLAFDHRSWSAFAKDTRGGRYDLG